jgi:hypothetical protein
VPRGPQESRRAPCTIHVLPPSFIKLELSFLIEGGLYSVTALRETWARRRCILNTCIWSGTRCSAGRTCSPDGRECQATGRHGRDARHARQPRGAVPWRLGPPSSHAQADPWRYFPRHSLLSPSRERKSAVHVSEQATTQGWKPRPENREAMNIPVKLCD